MRVDKDITDSNAKVVEANGKLLIPGAIDDQVHFRDPGAPHKGSFATESRAAVAGGITSVMDMPNTSPPTLTLAALEAKERRAAVRLALEALESAMVAANEEGADHAKALAVELAEVLAVLVSRHGGRRPVPCVAVLGPQHGLVAHDRRHIDVDVVCADGAQVHRI